MTTRRRSLAAIAASALAAPLLATGTGTALAVAPGDAIPPEQQSLQAFCTQVLQTDPFTDIAGATFERAIECLAAAEITLGGPNGLPPDRYGPDLTVQRDAMASFVVRLIDTANELSGGATRQLPAYDGTPAFTDVPATAVHHEAINRLAQAGIVEGGAGGRPATEYSPGLAVSRAQMASFLNRAHDFTAVGPLRTENDYFTDDEGSVHEDNINGIASEGIAVGDGRKSYNPSASVTRGQMAAFLTRLLSVMHEQGLIGALPPDSSVLREAVTAEGVYDHLQAFQDIADGHDGTRASGTPGYDQSVDYVVSQLTSYGYEVTVQDFEFPFFQEVEPSTVTTADGTQLETGAFTFSGSGEVVDGQVVDVDYRAPLPDDYTEGGSQEGSTAGCEPADFDPAQGGVDVTGKVALIQRGTCPFGQKAANAEAAGAIAVIIYNEGQEGRQELLVGTLGEDGFTIPVVGLSFPDARALIEGGGPVDVFAKTVSETRTTSNVIAESATGDDDNVVMLGAHLDSVIEGPGINDNGTGSAALIEIAEQAADLELTNTVRFAWWGAEELGLLGSEHYVAELTQEEIDAIALYLNFDMIGSPNFVRFVYDGDGSAAEEGPQGSAAIEYVFSDYFESQGLASEPTEFSGRSDYGPFIAEGIGIPSGGLFTGAEGLKTERQAEIYGGEAGIAYDPCYHEACDTIENVDVEVLGQNADAIAHALVVYAASTDGVYDLEQPDRTEGPGTSAGDGGMQGGLHEHAHESA